MASVKEGAASMARRREMRRRRRSAGAVREEERSCGLKGQTGRQVARPTGPSFEGKFLLE
jgi:hypothetical protein